MTVLAIFFFYNTENKFFAEVSKILVKHNRSENNFIKLLK